MHFRAKPNYLRGLSIACTALAAGLLSATSSSASATHIEDVTEVVRYDDLNMNSPAGRTELRRRVDRAVDRVCSTATRYDHRRGLGSYKSCKEDTLKAALAQLDVKNASARGRSCDDR